MKKVYELDINDLEELNDFNKRFKEKFENKYQEIISKYQNERRTDHSFIKIDGKFYKIQKTNEDYELGDFCNNCDFKKQCWDILDYCILDYIFRADTNYVLKEIDEFEIVFGGNDENN